jgi:hypothetical protein
VTSQLRYIIFFSLRIKSCGQFRLRINYEKSCPLVGLVSRDSKFEVRLYGCETWSLTLGEEHGLRVFENGVMRRMLGLKRVEVTAEWRKLHSEEVHNLYSYSSPNIIMQI